MSSVLPTPPSALPLLAPVKLWLCGCLQYAVRKPWLCGCLQHAVRIAGGPTPTQRRTVASWPRRAFYRFLGMFPGFSSAQLCSVLDASITGPCTRTVSHKVMVSLSCSINRHLSSPISAGYYPRRALTALLSHHVACASFACLSLALTPSPPPPFRASPAAGGGGIRVSLPSSCLASLLPPSASLSQLTAWAVPLTSR